MKKYNKGFTLIELLVVIAIIGILASVVLASLNSARAKGADAAIKSNLSNTRAAASMYWDTNSGYSIAGTAVTAIVGTNAGCSAANTVFANTSGANTIYDMVKAAQTAYGGSSSTAALCSIGAATTTVPSASWAVYVPLKNPSTGMVGFCVDSNGTAQEEAAALSTATCA